MEQHTQKVAPWYKLNFAGVLRDGLPGHRGHGTVLTIPRFLIQAPPISIYPGGGVRRPGRQSFSKFLLPLSTNT